MGKKNKNHPDIEEILARPWCYYCERDFDDLKILISHQKAKHFKCERCGRRLNTAGGLNVHMSQVHKESLMVVDNALAGRSGLDVEIFGMEGIPEDVKAAHENKMRSQFQQAEAARRSNANNIATPAGGAAKKPRLETADDIKRRLAEHKARMEAAKAGGRSESGTPGPPTGADASPAQTESPATYGTPQHPVYSPPAAGGYADAYSNSYGQAAPGIPGPQHAAYQQFGYPQQVYQGYPGYAQPGAHPQQTYGAPYQQYSAPHNVQGSLPPRPNLPAGLPQRPPSVPAQVPQLAQDNGTASYSNGTPPSQPYALPQSFSVPNAGDLEAKTADLAVKSPSDATAPTVAPTTDSPAPPATDLSDKKAKKDKVVRLVYTDDNLSPEEKRALLPRYAYAPNGNDATETI